MGDGGWNILNTNRIPFVKLFSSVLGIHSLTKSLSYSLTHSLTHSFTYLLTHLLTRSSVPKPKDWGDHVDIVGSIFDEGGTYQPPIEIVKFVTATQNNTKKVQSLTYSRIHLRTYSFASTANYIHRLRVNGDRGLARIHH